MSFSVIVSESTAAPAKGSPTDTGTGFFVGKVAGGSSAAAALVTNMDEFAGTYTDRDVTGAAPLFDAVEGFFGQGGSEAYIGPYSGADTYADGLSLLNDRRQGPGQLTVIGTVLSEQVAADVVTVCGATNRVALLDVTNGGDLAAMEATAAFVAENTDLAAIFGSWAIIPAPLGVIGGTVRTIPASPIIAGLCNRVDGDGNPNRAAMGRDYPLDYLKGIVSDPSDADRATLLSHGVNMMADDNGLLINAGFQTNIPSTASDITPFWQFNCARARMWLKANIQAVAAGYFGRPIDGKGQLGAQLASDLDLVCSTLWDANGLFGDTAAEAYSVTVTPTLDEVGRGTLAVQVRAKFSSATQLVTVALVSVPVTGTV